MNIGIIGLGGMGRDHLERVHTKVPGARVTGLYDIDSELTVRLAGQYGATAFDSAEALINSPLVDAVMVVSVDQTHYAFVMACIEAGKPVLCEKPLASGAAEAADIIRAEQAAGRRLVSVGFMRRFDPAYQDLKRYVDEGSLGAVLMAKAAHRNVKQPPYFQNDMVVNNVAIHEIDIFRWLLGEEYRSVQYFSGKQNPGSPERYDDPVLLMLTMQSGLRVMLEVNQHAVYGYDIQCELLFAQGAAELDSPAGTRLLTDGSYRTPVLTDWTLRFKDAYDIEVNAWVRALSGHRIPETASAWDGYVAAITAETLLKSRDTDAVQPVLLPERPAFYR